MAVLAELLSIPENPAPGGANIIAIPTADRLMLRAACWLPSGQPRGTICLLQGRAEFIEKYFEVISELLDRGFAVVAFDWRGQGRSARSLRNEKKGHIDDFSCYHRDLQAINTAILQPLMPKPHFALAHSMGGAIALDMAGRGLLPFERVVAIAPMMKVAFLKASGAASFLASTLSALGFTKAFVPFGGETSVSTKPFPRNRLSSDPERYRRISEVASALGSAAIGSPTIGWMEAAFRVMRTLNDPEFLHQIKVPFLLLTAGSDPVCDSRAAERAAVHIKNCRAMALPRARHEILCEKNEVRKAFWAAFDAFIPGEPVPQARSLIASA